jgi:valyl-tRNA synthetase
MSEIPKAYEPQSVESKWYQFWLDRQCFVADPARVSDKRPAYSIVIPPPNVTGMLHMGHVLNNTIQDILSRKARMDGKEVLWLPGTDHAGIATEGMVEKQVRKEEKKSKRDLGREEFLKRVWAWKEKHGGIIIEQLKKLGCSCDWNRQRFTMDEHYMRCVQRVFVDLYKKGLIYRGKRMVNWCPATLTALSDEEVEMEPQQGFLWHFKVEVAEQPGTFLTIATTRPETIPGDTAIAVHPKDPRYAALIGKRAIRPLPAELKREQKLIPIIADDQIDPEFGTGVLKVTPAHDKADFEIGQRHNLPAVDIMNPNATMNDLAGADLRGLDRFEARKVAVEKLKELGALVKEQPYENKIGFSQRARVPIEPRLSEQWFLKYPSVEPAKTCVEQGSTGDSPVPPGDPPGGKGSGIGTQIVSASGTTSSAIPVGGSPTGTGGSPVLPNKMRFHPQRWAKVYDHWLGNIQDWCISRQLWWGHRIPVWRKRVTLTEKNWTDELLAWGWDDYVEGNWSKGSTAVPYVQTAVRIIRVKDGKEVQPEQDPLMPVVPSTEGEYDIFICCCDEGQSREFEKWGFEQDPDVLDTWFSSWLWPFATMGWTGDSTIDSKNETLKKFYPTTDLVTGPDIIFFWVARMIMAGYEFMGDLPFRNVYFTGIIRDKQGRKMSKQLGNSPDSLELIAKYGADAIRFGTMRSAPLGQDVLFDEKDVELGRNFCNKLWNACRFRQMQGQSAAGAPPADYVSGQTPNFRQGGSTFNVEGEIDPNLLTSDDKWILLKLDQAIREIDEAFADYKFNEVTQTLYRFFWSEYCDWYVEASKAALTRSSRSKEAHTSVTESGTRKTEMSSESLHTLAATDDVDRVHANKLSVIDFILSNTLRLFHPFLPFITEELWHGLGYNEDLPKNQGGDTIMSAHWPKPLDDDFKAHYGLTKGDERFVDGKYELVSRGRNLRREFNIPANKKARFILRVKEPLPSPEADVIKLLLNAEALQVDPNFAPKKGTPSTHSALGELFLPLEGLADVEAETARLKKERAKIDAEIEKAKSKLNNPDFVQNAPSNVLEEHKKRLAEWQAKQQQLKAALDSLQD